MELTLLNHRIIFLAGEIDTEMANLVIQKLLLLNAMDQEKAIDLYINSPGGSVSDGFAIIDTMHCINAPVKTICIGRAESMGAWVLAAGSKGERFATPNAEIMLHQMASGFRGQTSHIRSYASHLTNLQDILVKMLSKWTGKSEDQIQRDIEVELFMNAKEAKEYGLIDHILDYQK